MDGLRCWQWYFKIECVNDVIKEKIRLVDDVNGCANFIGSIMNGLKDRIVVKCEDVVVGVVGLFIES